MSSPAFSTWLLATRPKTLPAAASPVMIGAAMAIGDGQLALLPTLAALVCALLIQIGTNYANDYFDFVKGTDTDNRLGPTRATHAGLVTPGQMKRATMLVFGLALLVGLYLVIRCGWPILIIGVSSVLFGVLYTGGPFPLGYNGLGDVFVLIFFGPVAVAGTYFVNVQAFSWSAAIAGLVPGLFSVGILTVNNLRDIENDRAGGKQTLAVRFGRRFTIAEFAFCLVGAHIISAGVCITAERWAGSAALLTIGPSLQLIRRVSQNVGADLNIDLAMTGKLLFVHSLLFSIGWVLV